MSTSDSILTLDRFQLRRSFTAGYRPGQNGTRELMEGEPFMNFADGVLLVGTGAGDFSVYPFLTPPLLLAAMIGLFDTLPILPDDDAAIPAAGGLFREGAGSGVGYRLVRILPKAP